MPGDYLYSSPGLCRTQNTSIAEDIVGAQARVNCPQGVQAIGRHAQLKMLCNSARRLAPRVAGCPEKMTAMAHRKLAVEMSVSRMHSGAVTAVGAGEARWGSAASQERGCRRWSSTEATTSAGLTLNVDERISRVKHRIPQKRASLLLSELRAEQCSGDRGVWPDMKIGDAVEVTMFANKKAARTTQVRGVLVRKVNRGIDSTILLRDVINGNSVESHIPLFSPLIESIEVMETAFIYQGKLKGKRVRPARIYYIRELDQKYYRITGGGGSEY